jgi:hypothetical protein
MRQSHPADALLLGPMLTFDKPHRPCSEGHSCIPTRSFSR